MTPLPAALPPPFDRLFPVALAARAQAYAPYSGYAVGAAMLDEAGAVHRGCNVENAAYPVGTCAEAGALAAMAAVGGRRLAAALVLADGPAPVSPCGACRQRLREFGGDDVPVCLAAPDGRHAITTIGALLPGAFGPDHLPAPGASS